LKEEGFAGTDPTLAETRNVSSKSKGRLQSAPTRYLTAAGFALLTAIATAILWMVVGFVVPLARPIVLSRTGAAGAGSGGVGAVIGSGSILLAALLGFVGGFVWMLWRR
jgi:hypothetical protein